jgi:hypothetical protein
MSRAASRPPAPGRSLRARGADQNPLACARATIAGTCSAYSVDERPDHRLRTSALRAPSCARIRYATCPSNETPPDNQPLRLARTRPAGRAGGPVHPVGDRRAGVRVRRSGSGEAERRRPLSGDLPGVLSLPGRAGETLESHPAVSDQASHQSRAGLIDDHWAKAWGQVRVSAVRALGPPVQLSRAGRHGQDDEEVHGATAPQQIGRRNSSPWRRPDGHRPDGRRSHGWWHRWPRS